MRKVVKSLFTVLVLGLVTLAFASCGGAGRALEGTWTGGGQTIYFNRDGSGTLATPSSGNAPQVTYVFDWSVNDGNLVLDFVGYNETFTFEYRLDDPSPGMNIYLGEDLWYRFRRDDAPEEHRQSRTLYHGLWRRPNDPLSDTERSMMFHFFEPNEDDVYWVLERDINGVEKVSQWSTAGNTFTTYFQYPADARPATSRGAFNVDGDTLTATINGQSMTFTRN